MNDEAMKKLRELATKWYLDFAGSDAEASANARHAEELEDLLDTLREDSE